MDRKLQKLLLSLPAILRRQKMVMFLTSWLRVSSTQRIVFNANSSAWVDLGDPDQRQIFLSGVYDPEFFQISRAFIAEGGVFFDVGANFGLNSFGLPVSKNKLRVFLFEANPHLIPFLERSIREQRRGMPTFALHNCIVSESAGELKLQLNSKLTGRSFVSIDGEIEMPSISLDFFCQNQQIETIDFLKMDIEGSEIAAISGARKMLKEGRINALFVEVSSENLARRGLTPTMLMSLFDQMDYKGFFVREGDLHLGATPAAVRVGPKKEALMVSAVGRFPDGQQKDILFLNKASLK